MVIDSAQDQVLFSEVNKLKDTVSNALIPDGLKDKVLEMIVRLMRMAKYGGYSEEY